MTIEGVIQQFELAVTAVWQPVQLEEMDSQSLAVLNTSAQSYEWQITPSLRYLNVYLHDEAYVWHLTANL